MQYSPESRARCYEGLLCSRTSNCLELKGYTAEVLFIPGLAPRKINTKIGDALKVSHVDAVVQIRRRVDPENYGDVNKLQLKMFPVVLICLVSTNFPRLILFNSVQFCIN